MSRRSARSTLQGIRALSPERLLGASRLRRLGLIRLQVFCPRQSVVDSVDPHFSAHVQYLSAQAHTARQKMRGTTSGMSGAQPATGFVCGMPVSPQWTSARYSSALSCTASSSFRGLSVARRSARAARMAHGVYMLTSNDFKTGTTIEIDGTVYRVLEFLHVKPGKGAAFVRSKLKNLKTGNNVEKTFKAGESVQAARLEKMQMQYTYKDGEDFVFMNMESYEEERISAAVLGDRVVNFMMEGTEVEVVKHEEDIIGCEIPKNMSLTVTQTDPGVKGNTVQGGTKPATVESGAVIQVPLFINEGEKIIVNTEEAKYVSRDNE